MKNIFQLINALAILLLFIPEAIMGADWEKQRDALLKQADDEFNKILKEKVQPEKIAQSNGLTWPIQQPKKHKLIIRNELITEIQKIADAEFSQEYEEKEIMKLREQYALYKLH